MNLQDQIKHNIDLNDLSSVRRGFNRLWSMFLSASPQTQIKLLNVAEVIRTKLTSETYEWKVILKRIDGMLCLMRKAIK